LGEFSDSIFRARARRDVFAEIDFRPSMSHVPIFSGPLSFPDNTTQSLAALCDSVYPDSASITLFRVDAQQSVLQ